MRTIKLRDPLGWASTEPSVAVDQWVAQIVFVGHAFVPQKVDLTADIRQWSKLIISEILVAQPAWDQVHSGEYGSPYAQLKPVANQMA